MESWSQLKSLRIFCCLVIAGLAICLMLRGERSNEILSGTTEPVHDAKYVVQSDEVEVESVEQEENENVDELIKRTNGALVRVPLPIVGQVDAEVKQQIARTIERLPNEAGAERPVLVLEFDLASGATGEGSEIGRSASLARYLTSNDLSRVRTVAYLPASKTRFDDVGDLDSRKVTELRGHAVLVALCCEQLVMEPDTAIGAAGIDEGEEIDEYLMSAYRANILRRRTFPEPLAQALLDKKMTLFRVTTDQGTVYKSPAELEKLEADGDAIDSRSITEAGSFPLLTSEMMLEFRLIDFRVKSRRELADRLGIPVEVLLGDPSLKGDWNAVHLKFEGPIHKREVDWILKALNQRIALTETNLIIVEVDSHEGESSQCLRMAQKLASFNPLEVRTVAFLPHEARGATSLVALACDHLIMSPEAILGGPTSQVPRPDDEPGDKRGRRPGGPPRPNETAPADLLPAIKQLAQETERSWSLMYALIDPSQEIDQMRNNKTGKLALLSAEEVASMEKPEDWRKHNNVDTKKGITGIVAGEFGITRQIASSFDEVKTFYQLEEDPQLLQPTLTDKWIQRLGKYLSSPMIAGWLLFGAMFFFMVEMSNPGVSFPGFMATVLFMLFFWSQYCDGNANWLEILLFVIGAIFICLEIFVVPGVGIFGIGGGIMVLASIVLATQDFLIPRTSEQLKRLPVSLSMILFAGGGMIASAIMIRTFLPHIPYLNKLILDPPGSNDELKSLSERESLTHLEYLVGKRGVAATPLLPSGKAQFGDEIHAVITDGRVIEKGESVVVRRVAGNRVEVAPD